jgi:hypothetical protein
VFSLPRRSARTVTAARTRVLPREQVIERGRGSGLRVVEEVGVGVQGDLGAGVPEPLLDDLDRLSGLEEQGGVGVAQLVHGERG